MINCSSCGAVAGSDSWCEACRASINNPDLKLSPPGKRFSAFILDIFIFLFIFFLAGVIMVFTGVIGLLAGLGLMISYVIWEFVLFARGMTPGKKLLGMKVVMLDGRPAGFLTMLIRNWIGKYISSMMMGIGFVWIIFDRNNQGLHDKLVGTCVVG